MESTLILHLDCTEEVPREVVVFKLVRAGIKCWSGGRVIQAEAMSQGQAQMQAAGPAQSQLVSTSLDLDDFDVSEVELGEIIGYGDMDYNRAEDGMWSARFV